jgi:hypothetical protein
MTGPEHYRRAEELLAERHVINEINHAAAHIHALLALAAATAVRTEADGQAWISVAGTKPPAPPPSPSARGPEPARPAGMPY